MSTRQPTPEQFLADVATHEMKIPLDTDRVYPCVDCGALRSKDEGATIFTVCDKCWDKKYAIR